MERSRRAGLAAAGLGRVLAAGWGGKWRGERRKQLHPGPAPHSRGHPASASGPWVSSLALPELAPGTAWVRALPAPPGAVLRASKCQPLPLHQETCSTPGAAHLTCPHPPTVSPGAACPGARFFCVLVWLPSRVLTFCRATHAPPHAQASPNHPKMCKQCPAGAVTVTTLARRTFPKCL